VIKPVFLLLVENMIFIMDFHFDFKENTVQTFQQF